MGLLSDLDHGPVALDSSVFIYFIEEHREYLPIVEPLFAAIDAGDLEAVTCSLTLLEVLVRPLRADQPALAQAYEAILTGGDAIRLVPMDLALLQRAAKIRAATGLKTPDALQFAAAVQAGCRALVTNDRRLHMVGDLHVFYLSDYLQ